MIGFTDCQRAPLSPVVYRRRLQSNSPIGKHLNCHCLSSAQHLLFLLLFVGELMSEHRQNFVQFEALNYTDCSHKSCTAPHSHLPLYWFAAVALGNCFDCKRAQNFARCSPVDFDSDSDIDWLQLNDLTVYLVQWL